MLLRSAMEAFGGIESVIDSPSRLRTSMDVSIDPPLSHFGPCESSYIFFLFSFFLFNFFARLICIV